MHVNTKNVSPGRRWNILLAALVFLVFSAGPAAADSSVSFTLSPSYDFGYTGYRIDITGEDPPLRSRLRFPLDSFSGAASAEYTLSDGYGRDLVSISASVRFTLTDPLLPMIDDDWILPDGQDPFMFSHTTSDVSAGNLRIGVNMKKASSFRESGLPLWSAGMLYSRISQEILGYSGWQVDIFGDGDSDPSFRTYLVSGDEKALTYTVNYLLPYVGLAWKLAPAPGVSLGFETDIVLGAAVDDDNHLLRSMKKSGIGFGGGFRGALSAVWKAGTGRVRPYAALVFEYLQVWLAGSEMTSWYGDDPSTHDFDETGESEGPISHSFNYSLFSGRVEAGIDLGLGKSAR